MCALVVHAAPANDAPSAEIDQAVAQTVLGILGFARWPGQPTEIRLCVLGRSRHADALLEARQTVVSHGRRVSIRQRAPVDAALDCDALYLGALSREDLLAVRGRIAGRAELTLHEDAGACGALGMFCLDISRSTVGFEVNLDALARSGVRVHPGVLQLGRPRLQAP
jgi:hypothetical protein